MDALLARSDVDAIDVCTPTTSHEAIVTAALSQGRHVMCQKPFALDLGACDRMIAAAESSDRVLVVPHMHRHTALTTRVRDILGAGILGVPLNAHYQMICPYSTVANPWFHDLSESGGPLVDTLIHGFDLFNWYFGLPVELTAHAVSLTGTNGSSGNLPAENAAVLVRYAQTVASLRVSWTAPQTHPLLALEIIGERGALRLETPSNAVLYQKLTVRTDTTEEVMESASRGHIEKAQYFVDAVNSSPRPEISGPRQARDALRVALAALQSSREGHSVRL